MSVPPITVNGQPFFGRVEEQKQFRDALGELLRTTHGEPLPFVLLIYGDGGIGKTTLARRFHDIVRGEYRDQFQTLWVDWEDERRHSPRLQVGREHIGAGELFDSLHAIAVREGWGEQFAPYQDAQKDRSDAEQKVAEALLSPGEKDDLADLRGTSATVIAKLVRFAAPVVGDSGEALVRAFADAGIKGGAEGLMRLRAAATNRLTAKLGDKLDTLFYLDERLAAALAAGFRKIAERQPLVMFLDTYEIVDRADHLLRMVIQRAGPRLLWVIAGRDNLLRSRQFGGEYFKGYAEEFPRRLHAYDMRQLAREDIRSYFAACVPDRPINDHELAAISRATRGIPLAVREAADIWKTGQPLEEIARDIDDNTPGEQIVRRMTERYQLHYLHDEADSRALYALALARGDIDLLRTMLRPDGNSAWNLDSTLRRLERDYASVHRERARLHDDPAAFFLEYLKAPIRRTEPWMQQFARRAVETLQARLEGMSADLPTIEERCEDEDWVKAAFDLTDYLFWLDENQAWHWLMPRFVESLVYSREFQRGLVKIADSWKRWLSSGGKKRLKLLSSADASFLKLSESEKGPALLDELTRLERLGWFQGEGEAERRAILCLRRGQLHVQRKQYVEARRLYELAGQGLQEQARSLKQQLGETWYQLGVALAKAGKPDRAIAAYQQAITYAPNFAYPHQGLGNVYRDLGRYEEAIAAYQEAITCDPNDSYPYHGLGNVYRDLGRSEEAIASYRQAIACDPKDAFPHHGLGNVYRDLGRPEEAIASYEQAIARDPNDAYPHNGLGNVYDSLGLYDDAIAAYRQALARDPDFPAPYNNLAEIYMLRREFDEAKRHFEERIRLRPENGLNAFVCLGIITRHQGSAESDRFFQQALAAWDRSWRARFQSPATLLENKSIALLCTGKREAAFEAMEAALAERRPGDTFDLQHYTLLAEAPDPPPGIDELRVMVLQAGGETPPV